MGHLERDISIMIKIYFFTLAFSLMGCSTLRFKDLNLHRVEKVVTFKQTELENENLSTAGNNLLKITFTSRHDFSRKGRTLKKQTGNFFKHAYLCDSKFPLAFFFGNAPERIDVAVGDIYSDSRNIFKDDQYALPDIEPKTYYFYVVPTRDQTSPKSESVAVNAGPYSSRVGNVDKNIREKYNLYDSPQDVCFYVTIGTYFYDRSNEIRIPSDIIKKSLD